MTRKLTLGILALFAGLIISACGSKKSTSAPAAPVDKDQPTNPTQPPANCTNQCNSTGTFNITNMTLYMSTFGYSAGGGQQTGGGLAPIPPPLNNNGTYNPGFFNGLFVNIVNGCAVPLFIGWLSTEITGAPTSAECSFGSTTTVTTGTGGQQTGTQAPTLASSHRVDLQYNLQNGNLFSIVVMIRTGSNGGNGDIVEFFPRANSNELFNAQNNIALQQSGNSYKMVVPNGEIGIIQ